MKRRQLPLTPAERDLVVASLRYFDGIRYQLRGYVVMDDHVHVLVDTRAGFPLSSLLHTWKSYTSHEFIKRGWRCSPVWKRSAHDNVITTKIRLVRALQYIELNPIRRWGSSQQYPWVWTEPY